MAASRVRPDASSRRFAALSAGVFSALTLCAAAADSSGSGAEMLGFSAAGASAETQLEQRFDANLSAADLRAWMQQMSSEPNHVGSAHDRANAEFELKKFREWGWEANIETFSVLYPTPREVAVELVAPTRFTARLTEPAIAGDATSAKIKDELPAYNVYGADGDVTAAGADSNRSSRMNMARSAA